MAGALAASLPGALSLVIAVADAPIANASVASTKASITRGSASWVGSASAALSGAEVTSQGWTSLGSAGDDISITVPLGFTAYFGDVGFTNVFVGSNTYVQFGTPGVAAATTYMSISASTPATPALHICSSDAYLSKLYVKNEPATNSYRIRYEGYNSDHSWAVAPPIIYEMIFYKDMSYYDLVVGNNASCTNAFRYGGNGDGVANSGNGTSAIKGLSNGTAPFIASFPDVNLSNNKYLIYTSAIALSGSTSITTTAGFSYRSSLYTTLGGSGTKTLSNAVYPLNAGITLDTTTSPGNSYLLIDPTVPAGSYTDTISVVDSYGASAKLVISILINSPLVETATSYTINATVGRASFSTIVGSGGTGLKNFTLTSSPTNAGITLDTSTAASGIATLNVNSLAGTFYETVTATDSVGATASVLITVNVSAPNTPDGILDTKPNCTSGAGLAGISSATLSQTKGGDGCVIIKFISNGETYFRTFNYTGSNQVWTVPADVTNASISMIGAGGGGANRYPNAIGANGGSGGLSYGSYVFTPGDVYSIIVGQGGGGVLGTVNGSCYYTPPTFGGGGRGGSCFSGGQAGYYASGGGRTAIRLLNSADDLANAAGGGGGSYGTAGGNGGGASGSSAGGGGATSIAGGAGGTSGNGLPGTAGAKYQGGDGKDEGGGGGGGCYGGGGGGDNTGGGGGSSCVANLITGATSALPSAITFVGPTTLVTTAGVAFTGGLESTTGGIGIKGFTSVVSPSNSGITLDTTTTSNGVYVKVNSSVSVGTYIETLTAWDQYGMATNQVVTITVNPAVSETATSYSITTTSGIPITDTAFAVGGSSAKTFTLVGSPTQAGITLDTTLASTGKSVLKVSAQVPAGTYYETITATDTASSSAYVVITVLVNSRPVISAFDPGPITMDSGTALVDTFTATAGTPGYRYALTTSPINAGITLDTSTAGIAILRVSPGVVVGTYTATVLVTDSAGAIDSQVVTINVVYPRVITQPATCTPDAGFTNCIYVGYTGKVQSYQLPTYLFPGLPIQIEEWGAGGGGSWYTTGWAGSNGGAAGGYSKATHTVTTRGETLTVLVGQGGASQQNVTTFGGGGAGGPSVGGQIGSNGGGFSALYLGSDTSTPFLISGGGGGASPGDAGNVAGGGGGAGNSGVDGNGVGVAGGGGTLVAGGVAASGCNVAATAGSRFQGGSGAGSASVGVEGGGGGGGGYYGGGGGACQGSGQGVQQNGGGGGGSGYINTSYATLVTALNGNAGAQGYANPGGTGSAQWKLSAGVGGLNSAGNIAQSQAGNGLIVIQWNAAAPVISFDSNTSTSGTVPTAITETDSTTITLPGNTGTLLKNGFTAVKWNTAQNGTGTSYNFGDSFTTTVNAKLYAQYGATVNFDLNGGTGTTPSSILRTDTATFVLANIDTSTFTNGGLSFTAWNTKADGTGTFYRSGGTVTLTPVGGVQTLYAFWARSLTLTGSTGNTLKTTVTIAASETITAVYGTGTKRFTLTSSPNMNGGITLDTTTAASGYVVLRVASTTPVDTYTETITVVDSANATVQFAVIVRVNPYPTFNGGISNSGLVLNYDAGNSSSDSGTGTTWTDLGSNRSNATLVGSPTYSSNFGGVRNFNGSTQYATVSSQSTLANFTAAIWAKSNIAIPSTRYSPISAAYNGSSLNYSIYWNGSGTLYGGFHTSGTWYQTSATFSPTPGVWYHYGLSYDGANVRLYVNGIQLSSLATTASTASGGGVYLGADWTGAGTWNGSISNVQIYNRALVSSDIYNNYLTTATRFTSANSSPATFALSQSGPTVTPTYTVTQGTDTNTISVSPIIAGLTPTISGNTVFFTLSNGLASGAYVETITSVDAVGAITRFTDTITVTGSIIETATSTNLTLDSVQSYVDTVSVSGGVGPYTFALTSSPTTSKITLDTSTSSLNYVRLNFGTGIAPDTYTETVTATDANGISTYILISVTINAPPQLTHPQGYNGVGLTASDYSKAILKTGLALQLEFNDTATYSGTGTTINSLVGSISGSTTNSPAYTSTGGGYFTLDGVNGLNKDIRTSSGTATTGTISQFAWIYPTADGVISSEWNAAAGWLYQNLIISGGKLLVQFYTGTLHTSTMSVPFNQWVYVGYTYDGTTIKTYINGQLAGTSTSTRSAPASDQWLIGYGYGGYAYGNFRIGSFHVYSTTLSALDVQKNFVYTNPRYESVGVTVLQTTAGIPVSKSGYVASLGTGNKTITITPSVSGASIDTSTTNQANYSVNGSVAAGSIIQRMFATDQVGINAQYNVLTVVNPAQTLSVVRSVETTTVGVGIGADTVTVSGGTGTHTFTLAGSPTSSGFSLVSISDTQTALLVSNTVSAGTYFETVTVTDSVSATASIVIRIVVNGPPSTSATTTTLHTNYGTAGTDTITVSGGTGPFTFALSSAPFTEGISLDSSLATNGQAVIKIANWVPVGTYTETVTVTDSMGQSSVIAITIYVNASVSFNINGGSGVTPGTITQTSRGTITLPDTTGFSKSGYTFAGWVDSATVFNKDSNTVTTFATGSNPQMALLSPDGATAYTVNWGSSSVSKINTQTGTKTDITVGLNPYAGAMSPDGTTLWVSNWSANTVSKINLATNAVTTINVGSVPCGIAVTPDGRYVYVANWSGNTVSKIDVATSQVTSINVGTTPHIVVISNDSRWVYTANWTSNDVTKISVAGDTTTTISAGNYPRSMVLTPNGQFLYVENYTAGTLTKINTSTNATTTITLGSTYYPLGIAVSPDGSNVYTTNYSTGTWSRVSVNGDTGTTAPALSFLAPGAISVTPDNQYLIIADWASAKISRVKLSDGSVTVLTDNYQASAVKTPQIMPISANGNEIYVAQYGSSGLAQVILERRLTILTSPYLPPRNQTLLAQWTPRSYTITYDSNSATSGSPSRLSDTYTTNAAAITLPLVGSMVKTGYTFGGWSRTRTGASIGLTETSTTTDETLYAVWTANPYTITFNSNYGTPVTTTESITAGVATTLNANTFARTGYAFAGWNDTSTGTGTSYTNAQAVTFYSNATMYAQWNIRKPDAPVISTVAAGNDSVTVTVAPGSQACSQYISGPGTAIVDTTTAPGYCIFKITAGAETLTVPVGVTNMEVFAVAGGGGGGWGANAGGGGGGGIIYNPALAVIGGSTIQLKTGAGGAGNGSGNGANGESTTVGTYVAVGGGGGSATWGTPGNVGGSSGGTSGTMLNGSACGSNPSQAAGQYSYSGWTTYGSAGGPGCAVGTSLQGGGGGGATSPGLINGAGGNGLVSSISGSSVTYSAGGRGYGSIQGVSAGSAGSANTGTGGGPAAGGGSGFILIKFIDQTGGAPTAETITALDAAGNPLSPAKTCYVASASGSCVISGLTNNTTYKFVATATNTSGASASSAAVSATPLPWVVTYSPESGTVSPATDNFNYPFANTFPTPIRAGYTFTGWYDTRTAGTLMGNAGDTYTVTKATTFYARWTPVTYTIRYDSNTATGGAVPAQGSYATGGSAYVIVGNTGSLTKPGYTFNGWNTAANGSGTTYAIGFQDTATINIVLYAQWSPIAYSVTYSLNGGSGTTPTQSAVNYQQQFTLASSAGITRTGYTFAGWSDSTTTFNGGAIYTAGLSNMVLTAQWNVNKYLVTYDPNGATGAATDTSTLYTYGTPALTLTTVGSMVKTGYSFAGWSTTNNGSVIVGSYTPSSAITLYAIWTANNYTITFSSNYGTPTTSTETITAGIAKALNPNSFTRLGFTFSNWSVDTLGVSTSYGETQSVTLFGNLNLFAQWTIAKPDAPTISSVSAGNESATVTVAAAGSGGTPTSYIVTASPGGATCSITSPATSCTIAGLNNGQAYTFNAVAINSSGSSPASAASSSVTPQPFTINYTPGAGATTETSTAYYSVGDPLKLPSATKAGYTFAGWFTAATGGTLVGPAGAAYSPTADGTLYAQWTGITYAISYNSNGADTGTVPASGSYVNGGSAYIIAGNSGNLVKAGYTFNGWNTSSSGSGTSYSASANYSTAAALSLYAKWAPAALQVTYRENGGTWVSAPSPLTKYVGDSFTVALSSVITKTGFNFAGWSDGRNTYASGAKYTMGTSSETLTAVWVGIVNTVTYDLNYSGAPAAPTEGNHAFNDTFTVKAAGASRTGYTFAGWSDGTSTFQAGATYTVGSVNILLTAQWNIQSFTITYDTSSAAGGAVTRARDTFAYGSSPISLPQLGTIIKPGYTFAGWATTPGGTPIVGAFTPSANTTLYAVWTANTYTVTYDGNSGSAPDTSTVSYTSGTGGITLQGQGSMSRTGYTFGGWSTSADGSSPVTNGFAPTIDTTLYAKWNIINSQVTYFVGSSGGTQTSTLPATRLLGYNSTFIVDTFTSTDPGYVFAGWNDGNTTYGPGSTYRMGASAISLTAQWIAVFTVHYTLNGGAPLISDSLTIDGTSIQLAPAPTKYGYDFQGWQDQLDPAQPVLGASSAYTVGITHYLLSAVWTAKNIQLTFDTGTTTSITTSYGSTVTLPAAPTKPGYLFKNWSGGGATYGAGASVLVGANDIAFTAQWTPVKYFIYFDLNLGRSDTLIVDIDPIVGETITLTSVVPVRAGFTFLGWSDGVTTPPNGHTYWLPGDIYTQPAGNVTLTAQFSPNSYSVTYLLGGASGSAPTQSDVLTGGTFTLAAAPIRANYSFIGWSDGTNTLAAGSTYTVVANSVTLTAQWVSTLFTASYALNGGTGTVPAAVNLNTGETFTVAAAVGFSKAGYDFAGWSDGTNIRTNPYVITMGSTNIALTAQWTLQTPGKPGNPIVTPGNGSATIQVVAPSTGGTPTSYVVTASPGGATCTVTSPATSCVISPLTNGTAYTFTSQAINSAGTSVASNAVSATPATISGAPTNVVATPGNQSATISFNAPASNGGSAITLYTVTSASGHTATGSSSPITVTGLANGATETFTVTATNGIGTSVPSTPSGSITPATTPDQPTITAASVSGGAATIAFTAPLSNGGSAITSYTVISSPGGLTATGSTSPIVVPGLVTGTPYTFTVVANNAMGAGSPSAPSSTLVSALKPDAPPAPTAVAGNGQATITFAAPASNGGSTITSYTVTASPGGETATVTSGNTATVTGLTNGQAYTFTVTATNAIGTSLSSAASNSVTPIAPPTKPLNVTALAGVGSATITFDTPTSTGGSPITGYVITPSPATSPATFATTTSPITITGLTNGQAYTFTVKAVNAAGQSVASTPSSSVTPATVPDAPTGVVATPMDGGASVAFTAPSGNGSLITSYLVTASNGDTTTGSSSPIIVSGLTNGTAYTFVITAINGVGVSDTSTPSASIIPAKAPNTPSISAVTAGLSAATISVASGGTGGSAITSYIVTASPGGATCTVYPPATSCTISSLTPGTSYFFTAVAVNAVGQSAPSNASATVTPINIPGVPTSILAAPTDGGASISFTAPASNGSAITSYIATNNSTGETFTATSSPISVSGLTNGVATTFSIVAVNGAGNSPAGTVTITSRTVPDAPSISGVSTGNGQATISVAPPANNGGAAITSYTVTASPGGATCVVTSPATSCTISGLINGQTYTFSATATNAAGSGSSSTPSGPATPASAPSAPTSINAIAGAGSATISWNPPSVSGGSAVTSYVVTSSPSGGTCTVAASSDTCTISGLTNGTAYTFNVSAINAVGQSSAAISNSITPLDRPTAPRAVSATAQDGGAVVTFTAPASNGGAAISFYTVTAYPGGATQVVAGTSATFTGLTNGVAYTFDVVATNSEGDSNPSARTTAVTPLALTAQPDSKFDLTAGVSYTVDVSANGGTGPITYALDPSSTLPAGMVLDANTGIIAGTPTTSGVYVETVTATDANGASVIMIATLQVIELNVHSNNNGGGKYLIVIPPVPFVPTPAPNSGGGGPGPSPIPPIPAPPIPAPPIPNPDPGLNPGPSPAKPVIPTIPELIKKALATSTVISVPASAAVALPAVSGAPAKIMTVASASGTSLAVIITPTGTPPTSYLVTVTNATTGEVKSVVINGSASTQSIPISGLSPTATYNIAVIANISNGQALSVAGKVSTPSAVAAPYSKLTAATISSATAATSKITNVFPLSSSVSASLNGVNPSLASGVMAATSADGTTLAMTILPPAKPGSINSYVVMVTDRTTGIVTTQTILAGANPSSMALAGLAPGDNYSVAVIAVNNDGSQSLVLSNAIKMAGVSAGPAKPGVVVLKQSKGTTDSANAPKILKVVPKVDMKNKNKATVDIGNLKPGQRIKVTVKGKK